MKKIIARLAACLLLVGLSGCASAKTEENLLRIGMMSSSDVIPYVLIQQNKLEEKHDIKLQLEVFTSAKDRDAALQAGELDGVLTDVVGACIYQNAGLDVKITGITDGDYILVAGKDTGIQSINDIAGQSIAISENTLIDFALDEILTENGMQSDAVEKEIVPRIPDRMELLREGKIALGLVPEPFATMALADGALRLTSANEIGLYPAVSAFSAVALAEKGEAITRLYQAYNEAVDYMNRTPLSEYAAAVIDAVGYPEEMAASIEVKAFRTSTLPSRELIEKAIVWASGRSLCEPDLTYEQLTADVYAS